MNLLSLIIVLGTAFLASLWVSRSFSRTYMFENEGNKSGVPGDEAATLEAEHQRVLEAVLELDFDHEQGKLDEENYASQRRSLMQAGGLVLRRIDEITVKNEAHPLG